MAQRSLVQLRGFFELLPGGSKNVNPTDLTNLTPPQEEVQLILASGDNTITIPALAKGVIVVFDSASLTAKTIKGVGGDTGLVLGINTQWIVLSFVPASMANFIINSDALDTGVYTTCIFF